MWGRKQRRIAELEEQLKAAIEGQVTVRVGLPEPVAYTLKGLPKGLWYRVSFMFRVAEGPSGLLTEYSDAFVGAEPPVYFDGDIREMTGEPGHQSGWVARGPDGTIRRSSDVEG